LMDEGVATAEATLSRCSNVAWQANPGQGLLGGGLGLVLAGALVPEPEPLPVEPEGLLLLGDGDAPVPEGLSELGLLVLSRQPVKPSAAVKAAVARRHLSLDGFIVFDFMVM
jgi:hypothetical protein